MTQNPYHSPARTLQQPDEPGVPSSLARPSGKTMWIAYGLAPAVAPLVFILELLGVLVASQFFGFEVNPASFLVLPLLALTVGMVVCYLVAGAIGMPIAFYLRKRGSLSGLSIHGAALGWAVFFSVACSVVPALITGQNWNQVPLVFVYLACGVAPPVLLSATAFWWLVGKPSPSSHAL